MALESVSAIEMNSSSPSPPSTENLMSSNSTPGTESIFSSANPPSTPMDSRPGNTSGLSSANPPLTPMCSDSRAGDERGSSCTNPSPLMYPSSFCKTGMETTNSMPYPLPYGTGYAPSPTYYGSSQPGPPVLNYGVPYPGQPSYYPPPPPYYNPVYDATSKKKRNNCCLCRLVTITIILIACISIITLSLNFIYKPKYPSVSLTSATVYSFSTSSYSTISSDFSLTFAIKNPNKHMDIFYHYVDVSVSFGLDTITSNLQPDFFQNSRAETSNRARLIDVDKVVSASTVKGINDDLVNGGVVKFRMRLDAMMRFNRMKLFERLLWVDCPDVNIKFVNGTTSGGKMVGPPIRCNVDK